MVQIPPPVPEVPAPGVPWRPRDCRLKHFPSKRNLTKMVYWLHAAVAGNCQECTTLILDTGISVNAGSDNMRYTALDWAIYENSPEKNMTEMIALIQSRGGVVSGGADAEVPRREEAVERQWVNQLAYIEEPLPPPELGALYGRGYYMYQNMGRHGLGWDVAPAASSSWEAQGPVAPPQWGYFGGKGWKGKGKW